MAIHFSDLHGENIVLSSESDTASWSPVYSGGHVFSQKFIEVEDKFEVELEGSGHVDFGITKRDPVKLTDIREAVRKNELKKVTDVRVHKRTCQVLVLQRVEEEFRKIDFQHSGLKVVGKVNKSEKVWLYMNLKFGNLTARLISPGSRFHQICGENINFRESKKTSINLTVENPATVCCLHRQLYPHEYVTFSIKPITDGDKPPSKYHVVLGASEIDAKQLYSRDPESFKVGARAFQPYRWKFIQKFEKDDSEGTLRVGLNSSGRLTYSHSKDMTGEVTISDEGRVGTVQLLLELFRVSVSIEGLTRASAYDYACDDEQSVLQDKDAIPEEPVYLDLIADPPQSLSPKFLSPPEILSPPASEEPLKIRRKMDTIKRKPASEDKSSTAKDSGGEDTNSKLISVPTEDAENTYWEVQEVPSDKTVVERPVNETEYEKSPHTDNVSKNDSKSIPKNSSVQNLIQKFSNLEGQSRESSVISSKSQTTTDKTKQLDDAKSDPGLVTSDVEIYSSTESGAQDSVVYDSCDTSNTCVLGDMFNSVNVLLNIGKGKKDKKDKKKKK